jgi:predicted flap endonuclease-1-like 5' DNA nuclease/uncharacterized membrane-anchored protein YhcB (DUF1043 family)
MIWLNIVENTTMLLVAETLVIVIGSMLMGILLSYLINGNSKKEAESLQEELAGEKKQSDELREQMNELVNIREHLKNEVSTMRLKADSQSKTIYDQQLLIATRDGESKSQKGIIDGLQASIDSYQRRLKVIEDELTQAKNAILIPHVSTPPHVQRVNYDHVSKLLGKAVTENDLTLITGIGPKTSSLLQAHHIHTWEDLSGVPVEELRKILDEAGGIYKSQDPSSWPKQAFMASQSEWRKLRIFQETLKKGEPG